MKTDNLNTEKILGAVVGVGMVAGATSLARLDAWIPNGWSSVVIRTYLITALLIPLVLGSLKLYEYKWKRENRLVRSDAAAQLSIFKDELIGDVSHELRTPLTGIVGYAHLLDEAVLEGPNGEAVGAILGQAAELSRLVDDRVTSARISTGSLSLDPKPASVEESATQAADFLALHGVVAEIDCDEGDVLADHEGLRHILRNLLINAHHHGRPNIVVRGRVWEKRYVIQVIDHGRGAASHIVANLQSKPRRAQPFDPGELGLGLTNARALAMLMGGDLSYRHLGGETHFVVTLPLWQPAGDTSHRAKRFDISKRPHKRRRILAANH